MRDNRRADVLRDMIRRNEGRASIARRSGNEDAAGRFQNAANRATSMLAMLDNADEDALRPRRRQSA